VSLLKKVLLLLGALAALCIAVIYFAWSPVAERLAQSLLKEIASKGNNLGWKGLRVRGTSLYIESLEGWVPIRVKGSPFPIPISSAVEKLKSTVPLLPLISGNPGGEFSFSAYGGVVDGSVANTATTPTLTLSIKGVQLFQHPTLQGFGISKGVLDASSSGITLLSEALPEGSFSIKISDLSIPQLPQTVTQIPIPALEGILLGITGEVASEGASPGLELNKVELASSLLTADGALKATLPQGSSRGSCEASFSVRLSDQGLQVLGSAITLGSALMNSQLPTGTREFRIKATGIPLQRGCALPRVGIGPYCVTITFLPE
jgi:hypothetical protein